MTYCKVYFTVTHSMTERREDSYRIDSKTRSLINNVCLYLINCIYLENGYITTHLIENHKGLKVFSKIIDRGPMSLIIEFTNKRDEDYSI